MKTCPFKQTFINTKNYSSITFLQIECINMKMTKKNKYKSPGLHELNKEINSNFHIRFATESDVKGTVSIF